MINLSLHIIIETWGFLVFSLFFFTIWLMRLPFLLHQYRKGHGFKSRTGLKFFQVLFSTTRFSSILSC